MHTDISTFLSTPRDPQRRLFLQTWKNPSDTDMVPLPQGRTPYMHDLFVTDLDIGTYDAGDEFAQVFHADNLYGDLQDTSSEPLLPFYKALTEPSWGPGLSPVRGPWSTARLPVIIVLHQKTPPF